VAPTLLRKVKTKKKLLDRIPTKEYESIEGNSSWVDKSGAGLWKVKESGEEDDNGVGEVSKNV
ncbi:hypothetical protein A2U01_0023562, partial [Trifolium medium]|nr:hypothetical protein [Trifolium medium]